MKLRHLHIAVTDSLKTATRQRIAEIDEEGSVTRFEAEDYEPAHVHVIESVDRRQLFVHHDNYSLLRDLLNEPLEDVDEIDERIVELDDDSVAEEDPESGAVYIKLDPRLEDDNVTYQCPVSKAALARIENDMDRLTQ